MIDDTEIRSFRLAPMCTLIQTVTTILLALPLAFLVASLIWEWLLALPALFAIAIYTWIWLRFRPSRFVILPHGVEVRWPLKRREIPCDDISHVRVITNQQLKREIGLGMRIGAGGLWGGFGWLWTKRRGIVQMYVSRTDGYVWIERVADRPWLITPEQPEAFARALSR